ncbi:uncharacterized protein B0J16DRAFT_403696 [Fusarium flagelliforme]|uniref:uncharacterized protein n=1 Tax=Fusarium flagelliforme TaxID=2675880 RepID=UPI001E8E2D3D|nr:uncharacterized protein B0J16DRAFT_403696 [Fusarium flagelliforme]KAH7174166.1 hypothetical protein B0J16DRAFT_403696 [Fusarium flagelliforme]
MHFSSLFSISIALLIQVSAAWTLPQFVLAEPAAPTCQCGLLLDRNGTDGKDYVCEDTRLGPKNLPKKLILGTVMSRYDRFGLDTPTSFIERWWNVTEGKDKTGGWNYPEQGGFLLDERGHPVKIAMRLAVGTLVDRFGSQNGKFLSLAASPFSQRSLAPDALNTKINNTEFPHEYRVYKVSKAFTVEAGPIAPWFGQPGLGTQFYTGGEALNLTIAQLIQKDHLVPVASSELDIVKTGCGF